MAKPTENVLRLIEAGANVVVGVRPRENMVKLATAAKHYGVQLTIRGSITNESALAVIAAGRSHVTFDVSVE